MKGCGTSVTPVIAGVRSDIERLLQKFIETPSVRFEHFGEIFRDAKFSLIFAGRTSENEVREFSEKILLTALSFCFPPYSFHVSVGGLYLLYALFYLQPKKYRMQIRITAEQYTGLKQFLHSLIEQQHLDTCYVLNKLFRDQAFYICAYSDEHNPLNFHRFDNKEDAEKAAETLRNSQTFVHELANDNLIPQLQTIHEQYILLKKRLVNDDVLPEVLSLVDKNPMEYVKNVIIECEDKLERRLGVKKKQVDQTNTIDHAPSELTSMQKLKERRKAIKEQAYQTVGKQARHFRHRQAIMTVRQPSSSVPLPKLNVIKVRQENQSNSLSKLVRQANGMKRKLSEIVEHFEEPTPLNLSELNLVSKEAAEDQQQKKKRGRPSKKDIGEQQPKKKCSRQSKKDAAESSGVVKHFEEPPPLGISELILVTKKADDEQPKKKRGRPSKKEAAVEHFEEPPPLQLSELIPVTKKVVDEQQKTKRVRLTKKEAVENGEIVKHFEEPPSLELFELNKVSKEADDEKQSKKKRGRPSKNDAVVEHLPSQLSELNKVSTKADDEKQSKKKRGRPSKNDAVVEHLPFSQLSELNQRSKEDDEQPKKKRGRPSKKDAVL